MQRGRMKAWMSWAGEHSVVVMRDVRRCTCAADVYSGEPSHPFFGRITTSVLVTLALIYAFMLVSSPNKSVVVFGMDLTRLIRGVPVLRAARKHIRRGIEALPIYGPKLASFFNR